MDFRHLALAMAGAVAPFAQEAPPVTEIELSATVKKIAIAAAPAEVISLNADQVQREYLETLKNDLGAIQSIAVLKGGLPTTTAAVGPDLFKLWQAIGCEWLLTSKLSPSGGSGVVAEAVVYDVNTSRRVTSTKQNGSASGYRRLAHLVADAIEEFLTGTPGVANSRIVFCKEDGQGIKEIFQADRDGSNLYRLTNRRTLTMSPTLARDGRLAYLSYSPKPTIWGQKTPGGPHERLYPLTDSFQFNVYTPVFSPDGTRIAFVQTNGRGGTDIMLLEVATGRVRRLTGLNVINSELCWNPAGTRIAFTSGREGSPQLYIMDDDGTNVRPLLIGGDYNASPAWSPDGSMIAFVSRFEDNFDLFVYKLGDPSPYQITTGFANSENPAWSPDSRHLVFSRTRADGKNTFYVTNLSGSRILPALGISGCQQPIWVRAR